MADSFNELFGLGSHAEPAELQGWWLLQDNAANTTIVDQSSNGRDLTIQGGKNSINMSSIGPVSWLPRSLTFDGSNDWINGIGGSLANGSLTVLSRVRRSSSAIGLTAIFSEGSGPASNQALHLRCEHAGAGKFGFFFNDSTWSQSPPFSDVWHNISGTFNVSTSTRKAYVNKILKITSAPVAAFTGGTSLAIGADFWGGGSKMLGEIADISHWSRDLISSELAEWEDGPEPVNTVAPAAPSGSGMVGDMHLAANGTWDLAAPFAGLTNGIPALSDYFYTWYKATDAAGTGATPIVGAAGWGIGFKIFTPTAAEVGYHLGCKVRLKNSGGYDAAEDTFSAWMTNPIQSASIVAGWSAPRTGVRLSRPKTRRTVLADTPRRRTVLFSGSGR